jgi:hypothetical protein
MLSQLAIGLHLAWRSPRNARRPSASLVVHPDGTYGIGHWETNDPAYERMEGGSNGVFRDYSKGAYRKGTVTLLKQVFAHIGDPEHHD